MSNLTHPDPTATSSAPGGSTADAAKSAAADTASQAADQGREVAATAVDQAKDVAVQAKEQIGSVTTEARDQAQRVLSDATSELESQLDERVGQAAEAARSTAKELRALVEGRPEEAGRSRDLAKQAAERLDRFADRTDGLGARGIAEEVTDFARSRPLVFLAGAATAGLLVGRMARAGREASSASSSQPPSPSPSQWPSQSTTPFAGNGSPAAAGALGSLGSPAPGGGLPAASSLPTSSGLPAGPTRLGTDGGLA